MSSLVAWPQTAFHSPPPSYFFEGVDAILTGIRLSLNAVLICISLMTKDIEYFSICLLTFCSSFGSNQFDSFVNSLTGLFGLGFKFFNTL